MGTHRLICFRTDGNSQIASGHLMRCVSIALACRTLGMEVCFLVSDKESRGLLLGILKDCVPDLLIPEKHSPNKEDKGNGISVIQLRTAAYDRLEQELAEVISLLCSGTSSDVVYFLDSYYATEKYLAALKPYVRTAYLDDLRLIDPPVDLLVNYDVIPDDALPSYQAAYQKPGRLLLGAAYTPLRSQFLEKKLHLRSQARDILVTTGGSDPYHFCLHLARKILDAPKDSPWNRQNFPHMTFHLVAGKLNNDKEQLRQLAGRSSILQLHEDVGDMASLMERCDLAVSAAGTTLYELCALGIPAVSFSIASNQTSAARAFDTAGAIPWAGDLRLEPEKVFEKTAAFLTSMCAASGASQSLRKNAQEAMQRLVDGRGASRIAQALSDLA